MSGLLDHAAETRRVLVETLSKGYGRIRKTLCPVERVKKKMVVDRVV